MKTLWSKFVPTQESSNTRKINVSEWDLRKNNGNTSNSGALDKQRKHSNVGNMTQFQKSRSIQFCIVLQT